MSKKDLEMKKASVASEEEPEEAPEEDGEEEAPEGEEPEEAPEEEEGEEKKVSAKEAKKLAAEAKKGAKDTEPEVPAVVETIGDLIEDKRFSLRPKAAAMRESLASQPLVKTMVPRRESEPKDATHYYSINGFSFYVRKGVFQMLPEQVAQLISDTYGQDATLIADHPLNLKNNTAARGEFSR